MNRSVLINNFIGWSLFVIAAVVYILTLEPTASWWDCSEFIISAYKLEVGHPPGAPVHIILGRFFTLFAGDPSQAAFMVNLMSALASAATVMLLYWTIVHLARKLFPVEGLTPAAQIVVWGSGITGALAFAFTDSFWYSAVEGEVYALSSLFTAAVFWAIMKWENEAGKPFANRWLILIAYLVGLSIGVHLLNLLAIPAIGLVYYFKKYNYTRKGLIAALLLSVLILFTIQYIIIPGLPWAAFQADLLFVNSFGLPFHWGMLFFLMIVAAALILGIRYTLRRRLALWNLVLTAVTVILIGYSSLALILIRADANPPMNQNHPDNAFALLRYLNRDQYGDRPLLYGPWYNTPTLGIAGEKKYYNQIDGRYVVTGTSAARSEYQPGMQTLFPRMYSSDPRHIDVYERWGRVKGRPVKVRTGGEERVINQPAFVENLRFFARYQLGHMYFRYFMWNFAGRQNDVQGHGGFMNGNWISGIEFIDAPRVGPTRPMPGFMKDDPSRNRYFLLPLLFGLIGLFFQYNHSRRGKEGFLVVLTLFVLTGIAIIIYLNQTPLQPRERDYAYVGSFYAFAIWIGLAVPALWQAVQRVVKGPSAAWIAAIGATLLVPGILLAQNYDDHDRSGRYMTRDYAINYLESCAPNAILFTYGDNDTFPLWYVQEVEGVRPDIKIINISYLGTDWYISQHRMAGNEAAPVPFSFQEDQYFMGRRDVVLIEDVIEGAVDLRDAIAFMGSDDERTKVEMTDGQKLDYLPSTDFYLPVDKEKVLETGTVQPEDAGRIADTLRLSITNRYLTKSEWAVLNIIAANNWERPIYINHSLLYTGNIFFTGWLQFEGLTYRLVPIRSDNEPGYAGHVNTKILHRNVMEKFVWGDVNHPDVYLDDYNKKAVRVIQARYMFARLAETLIDQGLTDKAVAVLDRMFELFPDHKIPLTYDSFPAVEQYLRAGAAEHGAELIRIMADNSFALLQYYLELPERLSRYTEEEQEREMMHIQNLMSLARNYELPALHQELDQRLQQLIDHLTNAVGS